MTQRIRIWFGELVTMEGAPDAPSIEAGEMIIEEGRVSEIRSPRATEFDGETWDLSEYLILPGFVNAHCHLSLSGLVEKIEQGLSFTDWIRRVIHENESLAFSDRIQVMEIAARTLLRSGVTSLVDYLSHPELLAHYEELPFRQVLLLEMIGFPEARSKALAQQAESWLNQQPDSNGKLLLGLAAHAPYSCSPQLMQSLHDLAEKFQAPFSMHVSEVKEEVQFIKEGTGPFRQLLKERQADDPNWSPPGESPVSYLERNRVLKGLQAVHLNYMEEEDWPLLAASLGGAVFCPGSTRWLGRNNWLSVRRLIDNGLPVGLGTDSLASNQSLDFLREIRLAGAMLPDVTRPELLWMATRGGAATIGLPAGSLEEGQLADFIAFKIKGKPRPWWERVLDQEGPGPDQIWRQGVRQVLSEIQ